jgi:hypothetical protein
MPSRRPTREGKRRCAFAVLCQLSEGKPHKRRVARLKIRIRSPQAGKTGQIKIYTYDATPEIVQDLQTGTIRAALAQSPYQMGVDAVKAIIAYARDHKSNQPVSPDSSASVTMPLKILTKANVNSASSKPFEYQSACS